MKVRHLMGELSLNIRPLSLSELHEAVLLARRTRWYGNPELQALVMSRGLQETPEDTSSLKEDMYATANVVREIWLATLKSFRRKILRLLAVCDEHHDVPHVHRYRYSDLATPSLVSFIWRDLQEFEDVGSLLELFLDSYILEFHDGRRIVSPAERQSFVRQNADGLVPFVLEALGFDRKVLDRRPLSLFKRPAEKLFLATTLAQTLDWVQYGRLLSSYNSALEELVYHSRRLGGGDVEREESRLLSGMAAFFELIQPVRGIPLGVLGAAMNDVLGKKSGQLKDKILLSAHDQKRLLSEFKAATGAHREVILESRDEDDRRAAELLLPFFQDLGQRVSRDPRMVARLCHIYRDEYLAHLESQEQRVVAEYTEELRSSMLPQGVMLVEGPSDKIYFETCLGLTGGQDVLVKVEDCEGKDGVARRFREIITRHPYLGSVVAVLDGDADKQARDLEKLSRRSKYAQVFKFDQGEVEDQIPLSMHVEALSSAYPEGEVVLLEDLSAKGLMRHVLAKVSWNKKKVSFDKVAHAKAVADIIESSGEPPATLVEIAASAINLARSRSREIPRVESRISFDREAIRLARLM